jgi:hypothetical protein
MGQKPERKRISEDDVMEFLMPGVAPREKEQELSLEIPILRPGDTGGGALRAGKPEGCKGGCCGHGQSVLSFAKTLDKCLGIKGEDEKDNGNQTFSEV